MGLYDREYTQDSYSGNFQRMPQMRMRFPKPTTIVLQLLMINVAIFFVSIIIKPLGGFIYEWFQIDATTWLRSIQIWRLVSYQFLHDPAFVGHIFFNMLGLYMLGPTLEQHWGSKRFLGFYLGCGIAGGLFYILLASVGFLNAGVMVGASGAILGLLAACAILFPQFVVFIFLFPVPIRVASILFIFLFVANLVMGGHNAGGDAAHLAGMAAGALYVFSQSWRANMKTKITVGAWERKMTAQRDLQKEVDRILEKIHQNGIQSLSYKEKKILRQATEVEQKQHNL